MKDVYYYMPFFVSKIRRISAIKDEIAEHFFKYRTLYLLFLCFLIAGFVVGIIAGVNKHPGNTEIMPDVIIFNYLNSKFSIGQLFLSRLFSVLGMMILVWVLCLNRWSGLLSILIILFNSFIMGATCAVFVCSFKLVGFLNVIFCYLPCHLISILCLLSFCVVSVKYSFETAGMSGCVYCKEYFDCVKECLILAILFHFIACVVEIIIFPWLSSVIVIN